MKLILSRVPSPRPCWIIASWSLGRVLMWAFGQASHAPKLGLIKWRLRNWIQLVFIFSFEKSSEPWNWKWASYLQLEIKLRPHSWHKRRHSQNYTDSRITLFQNIGSSKHTQIQSHSQSFTLNPHLDHFVIMSLVFLITVHLETVSLIIIREYECEHGVGNARQHRHITL